jgi:hypothetical protein
LDSRRRFIIIFAALSMIPFSVFTFLNTSDIGLFITSYAILYFALRLILNPKMRTRVDILGITLLGLFLFFVAEHVYAILR